MTLSIPLARSLDQTADLLATAKHHTSTDHGVIRVYQGRCRAGAPFLLIVNTFDALGFSLRAAPRLRLAAADDEP